MSSLVADIPNSVEVSPSYQGTTVNGRYIWWAAQELTNTIENIVIYAKLIISEYKKLSNNEIDITEFKANTPHIADTTPLNYIRDQICIHYPN